MQKQANTSKDTARFQLDRFLNSENSHSYPLDAHDVAVLYTIAYYLDVSKNRFSFKQIVLAKRTRLGRQWVNHCINKLRDLKLIETKRHSRGMWIKWGENLVMSSIATS